MKKIVDNKDIKQLFGKHTIMGALLSPVVMKILRINKLNRLNDKIAPFRGRAYLEAIMEELDAYYDNIEEELSLLPKDGPFITVSNHCFGGLDGVMLIHMVSGERPDFKVLVNFLLSRIENIKEYFFNVNVFDKDTVDFKSAAGIRAAIQHLKDGNVLGLFPAGEVSTKDEDGVVQDIPWHTAVMKLIQRAKVPVVPIYFEGQNSNKFHRWGKINPLLRTARLPAELLNKTGIRVPVRIGTPISVAEQAAFETSEDFGDYLRARTYALSANIEIHDQDCEQARMEPIAPYKNGVLIQKEIDKLADKHCFFHIGPYKAFFVSYNQIPHLMYEVGRKREENFRRVGEGTYRSIDLDEYDRYYRHLILWDVDKKRLVGAYRIGMGEEIMERFGMDGFYNATLFKFEEGFAEVLRQSMELGRAFICQEYKFETMPMMLLFKGLLHVLLRQPRYKYFIGPVSISSWFPMLYRSVISRYLEIHHPAPEYAHLVHGRHPFKPDFGLVDADALLQGINTPDKLDRLLVRLSNRKYRLPSLAKRYLKLGCKVMIMNVDVDFNNSLDAFIILDVCNIPKEDLKALTKDIKDKAMVDNRFQRR